MKPDDSAGRVSSDGKVTIPADLREELGLLPDTEVRFVRDGDTVRIVKVRPEAADSPGDQLIRRIRGSIKTDLTTDELMELLRGE